MQLQIYKRIGVPGNPVPREIAAGHDVLRVIDGKADIIPGDVGYYLPAENWTRIMTGDSRPVKPHHAGIHWVPMLCGERAVDKFTYGLPDGVDVWTGDPAKAIKQTLTGE